MFLKFMKQVTDLRGDLSQINYDLDDLHRMVSGLVSIILLHIYHVLLKHFCLYDMLPCYALE